MWLELRCYIACLLSSVKVPVSLADISSFMENTYFLCVVNILVKLQLQTPLCTSGIMVSRTVVVNAQILYNTLLFVGKWQNSAGYCIL